MIAMESATEPRLVVAFTLLVEVSCFGEFVDLFFLFFFKEDLLSLLGLADESVTDRFKPSSENHQ